MLRLGDIMEIGQHQIRHISKTKTKFGSFNYLAYLCKENQYNMEGNRTIRVKRTREEILAWLSAARQRKKIWEEKVEAKWAEEQQLRKEAAESHYYEIALSSPYESTINCKS